MKPFAYTAYTADGKRRRGVILAESEGRASEQISAKGLLPSEVVAKERGVPTSILFGFRRRAARIDHDMLSVFTRQMAVLLSTGLTADSALYAVQTGAGSSRIESLAVTARAAVIEGEPLSKALEQAGAALPPWFAAAIRAGENSGKLDSVFQTLAEYLENSVSDRTAIISALIYPAFVSAVAILVCAILMVTVAPEIAGMFESSGQELPELTLWVLGIAKFIETRWLWLVVTMAGFAGLVTASNRHERLRNWRDDTFLKLPLIGRFMRMAASVQYLRTLALVINSRLPAVEALRFSAEVLSIQSFRREAHDAADALRRGENLSTALLRLSFLQPVSRQLIQAGEDSGRLGPMSDRAAVLAESWLRTERKRLITVLEPASMITVGGMVLIIVLAILLPIFDMQAMVELAPISTGQSGMNMEA